MILQGVGNLLKMFSNSKLNAIRTKTRAKVTFEIIFAHIFFFLQLQKHLEEPENIGTD
jgi:hypothetical protein